MKLKSKERLSSRFGFFLQLILIGAILCVLASAPADAEVKSSFLYDLSNFTGTIRYNSPRISIDRERNEVSVLYQNTVRVFNEKGMEIYQFGDDLDLGQIIDITTDRDGNILLLTYKMAQSGGQYKCEIIRCNFRGEATGSLTIKGLPPQFSQLGASRMIYHDGKLYFADLAGLRVFVTDSEGNFRTAYDLYSLLELKEKERGNFEVGGFSVDESGNILFTIPVLFTAYKLSPDGKISFFGKPGGAPGRFNIVTGIAADGAGNIYVVDKLKCAVIVFDKNYNYLTQFGYRGIKPGSLIAPDDVAIDKAGRVYVTQNGTRGVSVYKVTYN